VIARVLLAVLTVTQAVPGLWALLAPVAFFDHFPLGGVGWVALLPPYNEHLVRDAGAGMLALAVALALAAWWLDRRVVVVAVTAFLVFVVPHTVFHSLHLEHFPLGDAVAQQAGLVLEIVLAVAVLVAVRRDRPLSPAPR
jgi:ABC-type enterobactin transport system permease subunit